MKRWTIENTESGVVLGTYEAETSEDALDTLARDAGYRDQADADAQVGAASLRVYEAHRYQLQTRDAWAGRPAGTWLPAVAGTVNQTGKPDGEASTFDTEEEAEAAAEALEAEGLESYRVVKL